MASPEPKVYSLVSKGTNTVIDLEGAQSKNGTKIINYQNRHGKNQKWQIALVEGSQYLILNDATGSYLTAPQSGDGQLTGNLISPTDERARWKLHRRNNGAYEIESVAFPGKVVDNGGNKPDNLNPILLWTRNHQANQEWKLE